MQIPSKSVRTIARLYLAFFQIINSLAHGADFFLSYYMSSTFFLNGSCLMPWKNMMGRLA